MIGRVTVVGCGLISGSIVKGLRASGRASRLAAIDRSDVLAVAKPWLDAGAVAGTSEAHELLGQSDLVVLATPVGAIVESLGAALDAVGANGVVTDTGSVKGVVIKATRGHARAARLVAGHPMAGREMGGFEASTEKLFEGTKWFVVTGAAAGDPRPDAEAVERVAALAAALGAIASPIDAAEHDRAMAFVSHVPQLVASAVYDAASRAGVVGEAGSGFRDVTRIAGGPPSVWRDILGTNREAIAGALDQVLAPLAGLRDKLARGDADAVDAAIELLERVLGAKRNAPPAPPARGSNR